MTQQEMAYANKPTYHAYYSYANDPLCGLK